MQFKSCPSVHGAETSRLSRNIRAFIISFYQKKRTKKTTLLPPTPAPCDPPSGDWCVVRWGVGGGDKGRVGGVHLTAASWLKTPNYGDEERRNYIP